MKKLLSILLSAIPALTCFACGAADKQPKSDETWGQSSFTYAFDTIIRDKDGNDYCFWDNGMAWWINLGWDDIQTEKSATLSLQTEYDLCCFYGNVPVSQCWPNGQKFEDVEFEYDKTKIEIVYNPDVEDDLIITKRTLDYDPVEDHYIIKLLQPCVNEEVFVIETPLWDPDPINKPCDLTPRRFLAFTVSSAESDTPAE
ncbi:MAG: hypothetical protein K2M47_07745 [Clostridiales bacterium]|nr:hypothetical protein [Clostridiales bacterium]